MNRIKILSMVILGVAMGTSALFMGCDIESAESGNREVDIYVAGFYIGSPLVRQNTGASITTIDLRQNGDSLEGVDNNGNIFKGTIGQVDGSTATFNMEGLTTAGNNGIMSGTITDNDSGTATMQGTWIEDAFYSTIYGVASIPTNSNNSGTTYSLSVGVTPSGGGTVSPNGGSYASGAVVTLTASPSVNYSFSSWSGDASGSGNPVTITMSGNRSVTANFTTP